MDESRLTTVETAIAFQEKTIQDLSDEICRQQQELDRLQAQVRELTARFSQAEETEGQEGVQALQVPPHY